MSEAESLSSCFSDASNVCTTSVNVTTGANWENSYFLSMLDQNSTWANRKFVGMVPFPTYKLHITIPSCFSIAHSLHQAESQYFDVAAFITTGAKNIPQAESSHGREFTTAWRSLLSNMGYSISEVNAQDYIVGFYGNAWVCRPALFVRYVNFVTRALEVVNLNRTLKELLYVDSGAHVPETVRHALHSVYDVDYIPLLPFVFERLPAFFFATLNAKVYHLRPDGCFPDQSEGGAMAQSGGIHYNSSNMQLLVGVGPAKTSSSFLSDTFRQSQYVSVGDASLGNQSCCSSELNFFRGKNKSMEEFFSFFPRFPNAPLYFFEKTPSYSDDELVPYRVKTSIQHVHALFTLRDPFDGYISLYFHRQKQTNISTFVQYAADTLRAHERHAKCVRSFFDREYNGRDLSWVGNQTMDALVHTCRHALGGSEFMQFMYSTSLLRWMRVLGRSRVICIFTNDLIERPTTTIKQIFNELRIPWQECLTVRSSSVFKIRTSERFERLIAADEVAKKLSARIRHLYRKEFSKAKKLCGA
jgi:hypothetical protein